MELSTLLSSRGYRVLKNHCWVLARAVSHDRQHAVLDQALAVHLGKTTGDDATHPMGGKRPDGDLARAAATEIGASDKDRRAIKARHVEHEGLVGIQSASEQIAGLFHVRGA